AYARDAGRVCDTRRRRSLPPGRPGGESGDGGADRAGGQPENHRLVAQEEGLVDVDEAFLLGDQVVILETGAQIAQVGSPSEIIEDPASEFVASFIGADRGRRALRLKQTARGTVVVDTEGRTQGALVAEADAP